MDARHLLQLSVVLDKGSISDASRHLGMSQPTLTRNMATLERQAGSKLFARSRFGVRSTPLGERLGREGREIARRVGLSRDIAARHRLGIRGELRIGVGPLVAIAAMPALALKLMPADGHLALSIRCDAPNRLLDGLIDGELDVLIGQPVGVRAVNGFRAVPLLDDDIVPFCGRDHELARRRTISAADLADREWIVMGSANHFERGTFDLLDDLGVSSLRTQMTTSGDASTLFSVLAMGRHLSMLPHRLVSEVLDLYGLQALALAGKRPMPHRVALWHAEELAEDPGFATLRSQVVARFRQIAQA